ncbi:MAG: biotin--[acetyl-CoA-carboxylase] ligase [Bacteroidales bacterium]
MIYDINKIQSCDSTNTEAFRLKEKITKKIPFAVYCEEQTRGRGMGKNIWESEKGKNLTCSLIQYPVFLSPYRHFYFSMVVALSVYDILQNMGLQSQIKWPNDVLVDNEKICGILIESEIQNGKIQLMLAGIGININQTEFSEDCTNAVSLKQKGITHHNADTVLHLLIDAFNKRYKMLQQEKYTEIKSDYLGQLKGFQEWKYFTDGKLTCKAKIVDVRDNGYILTERADGKITEHEMKEISMIIK